MMVRFFEFGDGWDANIDDLEMPTIPRIGDHVCFRNTDRKVQTYVVKSVEHLVDRLFRDHEGIKVYDTEFVGVYCGISPA